MAIIPGTNSGETLTGTNGDDVITGLGGVDALYGLAGTDILDGGLDGDYLTGGPGDDTMQGGAGNDIYKVDSSADQAIEQANEGTDLVASSASFTLGDNVENLSLTGTGDIDGTGNALRNTIRNNAGINVLRGGAGNDSYVVQNEADQVIELANEGTDYLSSFVSFTLGDNIENLYLKGNADIDGTGNALNNNLTGNTGLNVLAGGAGNDNYFVQNTGDQVVEQPGEGTDFVHTSVDFTLPDNVEHMYLTGTADINGTGNALRNTIRDNAGINILAGGDGDDSYVVQNTADQVVELANGGTDYVSSSASYTLGDEVENLTLTGKAEIDGTGNSSANSIVGNSGANDLDGKGGNDILTGGYRAGGNRDKLMGGLGNDRYFVNALRSQVVEETGQGTDSVFSTMDFTLGANVENLYLREYDARTGSSYGARTGIGNELDNLMVGNSAFNVLDGRAGNDVLDGGGGGDTLIGGVGNDVVDGGDGVDTVRFSGWRANYSVVADVNGVMTVTDNVGNDGTDTLSNVEFLRFADQTIQAFRSGTEASETIVGTENSDVLFGNGGNDILHGGESTDTLDGGTGNDALHGGESTDTLDGGTGNDALHGDGGRDALIGGQGDDTLDGGDDTDAAVFAGRLGDYIITENSTTGVLTVTDIVGNDGTDTLSHIEKLQFADRAIQATDIRSGGSGNDTVLGTGNSDVLLGGAGNDTLRGLGSGDILSGGPGNDILDGDLNDDATDWMAGGSGNDTYFTAGAVDGVEAVVEEANEGDDTVHSAHQFYQLPDNVKNLILTPRSRFEAREGHGNELDNRITGSNFSDVLFGHGGLDIFVFATALDASDNVDHLSGDFSSTDDEIHLDSNIFTALDPGAYLPDEALEFGPRATSPNTRIVAWDSEIGGRLYYDSDGSGPGEQVEFARVSLSEEDPLTARDFFVI